MNKRTAALCALVLPLLLCWGMATLRAQELAGEYLGVSVVSAELIPASAIKKAAEGENSGVESVTAWRRDALSAVSEPTLGRTAELRPTAVYGGMGEVCPLTVVYGALPVTEDGRGCVIDCATAEALYGSRDVVGAKLLYNGTEYTVRAVAQTMEPALLYREPEGSFDNLELRCADAAAADTFLLRYGLTESYTAVETGFYADLAEGLTLLPGWIFFLALLFPVLREAFRRRTLALQLIILCAASVLTAVSLRYVLGLELSWPVRFLPTRWSDTGFWTDLIAEQRELFASFAFLPSAPRYLRWLSLLRQTALWLALACVWAGALTLLGGRLLSGCLALRDAGSILLCTLAAGALLWLTGCRFVPCRGWLFAPSLWWLLKGVYGAVRVDRAKRS